MADTISNGSTTFTFTYVKGKLLPQQYRYDDISRPGVQGVAYRQLPPKGDPSTLTALALFSSGTFATEAMQDGGYNSLVSNTDFATITIANVGVWSNYLVLHVDFSDDSPHLVYVGGVPNWQVISYWQVRYGST